jgi:hypothetical protein
MSYLKLKALLVQGPNYSQYLLIVDKIVTFY